VSAPPPGRIESAAQEDTRVDDRLAELNDEIDRILSRGPIGRWSNPPPAFPFLSEAVVFNADGSGEITSWSAMSGKTVQAFAWNMEGRGRLVMRYGLTRYAAHLDEEPKEEDSVELSPITHEIEVRVQETHLGPWPVMITDGRDTFDWLWTALSRDEPPLRLQPVQPAFAPPPRSLLSRMRNLVAWSRSNRHATV
jgi:hypothetical protein